MTAAENIRKQVSELCIDGVLNCFKEKTTIGHKYPFSSASIRINAEALRYYWALTEGIENIASIVIKNPRRMTSGISYGQVERQGIITGSLNASATLLAQMRKLDPTLFVVNEPNLTYQSEPNHIVAWTLKEAFDILLSARRLYNELDKLPWFNRKISLLENSLRNDVLKELLMASPFGKKRPNRFTLRAAAKSRVVLYQEAISMYDMLVKIEDRDDEAIKLCLSQTLVADLEYWQRLELGTGLNVASAISRTINEPVRLMFPFVVGQPIAKIGPYEVYWQYTIAQRPIGKLDVSEKWVREIAGNIGITLSDSRADIAVCRDGCVKCIFECKYSESDMPPTQAIVDASSQLVRYARDLNPDSTVDAEVLISKCFIIVADCNKYSSIHSISPVGADGSKRNIYFSDIKNIRCGSLETWAEELTGL